MRWHAVRTVPSTHLCFGSVVGTRTSQPISHKRPTARPGGRSANSEGGSKFSTWLYRIAYNTFLNHIRGPRRLEPLTEEQVDQLLDPDETPDEATARSAEAERLRRAVLELPDELRFAVTARFWAELSVAEIARHQGLSPVGIRKRLARAYKQLATTLEGGLQ